MGFLNNYIPHIYLSFLNFFFFFYKTDVIISTAIGSIERNKNIFINILILYSVKFNMYNHLEDKYILIILVLPIMAYTVCPVPTVSYSSLHFNLVTILIK